MISPAQKSGCLWWQIGSFIPARIMKVPIEIAGKRKIADVAFSDRLNIGFNLLGRKDVFDAFDEVVFRESSREVEVRWV
jgi:hypothetical protein